MKKQIRNSKQFLFYTLLVITSLLLSHCNIQNQNLKKLDNLSLSIDSIESRFENIDRDSIDAFFKTYMKELNTLKQMHSLQKDLEQWEVFTSFAGIRKPVQKSARKLLQIEKEIEYSRKQLSDLRDDYEKHKISDEEFSEYYVSEHEAIVRLGEELETSLYLIGSSMNLYDSILPEYSRIKMQIIDTIQ